MRLPLLLMLALGALLTEQASAQHDFHTALGRHLGWGSGPGYHAYSAGGQPTISDPQYHQSPTPHASEYPAPAGPRLAPPQLAPPYPYRQPVGPPRYRAPADRIPTQVPSAPTAYQRPAYQGQYAVWQQPTFVPPHLGNPLITPTGPAAHGAPQLQAFTAVPQPVLYWVHPTTATAGWADAATWK